MNILLADRHAMLRQGMTELLARARPGWAVSEASSVDTLRTAMEAAPAALIVLDPMLPGLSGAPSLAALRAEFPTTRVIVLGESDDRTAILDCLSAGMHGYVLRSASMEMFFQAVETVLGGGVFAPASLAALPAAGPAAAPLRPMAATSELTDRQIAVLRLLSEGCSTKDIARRLGLAVGTVKVHLAAVYRALGARNRVEALLRASGEMAFIPDFSAAAAFGGARVN